MPATIWDDPKNIDLLKKMWTEGASASEIARKIGEGCTRNSVIGKITRMHLPKRGAVAARAQVAKTNRDKPHGNLGMPKVNSIIARAQHRQRQTAAAQVQNRNNVPFRAGHLPDDGAVDVTHLVGMKFEEAVDSHGCLWCDGDPLTANHAFCVKRRKPGHRWCPEHYAHVYSGKVALV